MSVFLDESFNTWCNSHLLFVVLPYSYRSGMWKCSHWAARRAWWIIPLKDIIASRCWLIFISYLWVCLPSQNVFLKITIPKNGAAIKGTARSAKVLVTHGLIFSRNSLNLTYRKFFRKSNQISFVTVDLFTKKITVFLPSHNFPLMCKLEDVLALFCKYFWWYATFCETAEHWRPLILQIHCLCGKTSSDFSWK